MRTPSPAVDRHAAINAQRQKAEETGDWEDMRQYFEMLCALDEDDG